MQTNDEPSHKHDSKLLRRARDFRDCNGEPDSKCCTREVARVGNSQGSGGQTRSGRSQNVQANLEQKAKEIAEAYDVLSDVRKRKSYDNSLQRSKTPSAEEELPVPTKVRKVRFLVWGITSGIIVIVSIYSGFPPEVPHRVWELLLVTFIIILQIKIVGPLYGPVDDGDATHNVNVALRALLFFGILLYVVIRLKLQLAHLK